MRDPPARTRALPSVREEPPCTRYSASWRSHVANAIARWRRCGAASNGGLPESPSSPVRTSLGRAIADGDLRVVYQPKLNLRSRRIIGLEALVRWQHPELGLILPGDFIPAAEECDDIFGLTLWVMERAISDQRMIAGRGHDLTVFVNIAATLLADDVFIERACGMVQGGGKRIGFEVTETSVIRDPGSTIANLKHVSEVGIPIAIDDYGAGLSSLAYLKQLPACELKIDKLFITELTSSHRDPLIVRSTIDLAHAMEMEVVAEGVETPTSLALLTVMGCDVAQGYFISRPLCIDDLLAFLDDHAGGWRSEAAEVGVGRLVSLQQRA